MRWQVVIPLRASGTGKSRLRGATREADTHADLVRAIQRDALDAVLAARALTSAIAGVNLVTTEVPDGWDLDGVSVLDDPGGGLNEALGAAAAAMAQQHAGDGVLAMVADLPAVRPADLLAVLAAAEQHPRAVVLDHAGTGTTMLAARDPRELEPSFGAGSAARHQARGFVVIDAPERARSDVDTSEDLQHCLRLGVGEHTAAMLCHLQPFT